MNAGLQTQLANLEKTQTNQHFKKGVGAPERSGHFLQIQRLAARKPTQGHHHRSMGYAHFRKPWNAVFGEGANF